MVPSIKKAVELLQALSEGKRLLMYTYQEWERDVNGNQSLELKKCNRTAKIVTADLEFNHIYVGGFGSHGWTQEKLLNALVEHPEYFEIDEYPECFDCAHNPKNIYNPIVIKCSEQGTYEDSGVCAIYKKVNNGL